MAYGFLTDVEEERRDAIQELFAEAQRRVAPAGLGGAEQLGGDFADRFCFALTPNAHTKARWLNRRRRPEPETEEQAEKRRARERKARGIKATGATAGRVLGRGVLRGGDAKRRGRPRRDTSTLAKIVEYVVTHPGVTIAEVASGTGMEHRLAACRLYEAQTWQRVQRTGSYGQARFYPGPLAKAPASPMPPVVPEKRSKLVAWVSARAMAIVESVAKGGDGDLGSALEALLLWADEQKRRHGADEARWLANQADRAAE